MELGIFGELCKSALATVVFYCLISWVSPTAPSTGLLVTFLIGHFLGSMLVKHVRSVE